MQPRPTSVFSRAKRPATAPATDMGRPVPYGLIAGTRLETAHGWQPVEALTLGDCVYARNGRLRRIAQIERAMYHGGDALLVPGGALGNCAAIHLVPEQHVLFATAFAEVDLGGPFVLIPARALAGHFGIAPVALRRPVALITLRFAGESVVWANTGVLAHCLALGEAAGAVRSTGYPVIDGEQARAFLGLIETGPETAASPVEGAAVFAA